MAFDTEIMGHVKSLTDHEVFTKLKDMGFDIGPVMKTTRGVYERKLYRALAGDLQTVDESMGDHPSLIDDDEEDDDDDGDESSYMKRSTMRGSGDFRDSSKLFVEDSYDEEEEEDDGGKFASLDGTMDRRTKAGFELGNNEPANAGFLNRASDEDADDFGGSGAYRERNVAVPTGGRLYPDLGRSEDEARKEGEEKVEYYLRKYGPSSEEDSECDNSVDTSELRRRPLHSVREVKKTYPASFSTSSVPKVKEPEKTTPLHSQPRTVAPLLDGPSKVPRVNRDSSVGVAREESSVLCKAWKFGQSPLAIVLLVVVFFCVLVFLSLEPEPELPKLDIVAE